MKKLWIHTLFVLLTTGVYGQIWNQVVVPTTENLLDVEFPPGTSNVGYIGGENGVLLKTTDGGLTWTAVNYTGINAVPGFGFQDLEFVDDNIGFATLFNAIGLYKTSDGGATWLELDDMEIGTFCYRNVLHVIDENHFFAAGAGCFQSAMVVEFNNGIWSIKNDEHETFSALRGVRDIEFRGNIGIATVNDHLFLRSTDGGQNWDTIVSQVQYPNHLTDVIIINDTLMYAGHEEFSGQYLFFQSNDAGLTWWNAQPTGGDLVFYASWYAFEASANGDVYASTSQLNGPNFMHESQNGVWSYEWIDQKIVSIDSYSADVVYAVGDSGYVIVNSGTPLSLDKMNDLEVTVYPNPTLNSVHVDLGKATPADLLVLDLSGKVLLQVNFQGKTQVDLAAYASGVYFLQINAEGKQRIIKQIKR